MFQRIGAAAYKADLGNIEALCNALGNPQGSYPAIHVAGTNGKGSVSSMLCSILMEAGYKVGLFTSPHLRSFTERIRVNGTPISEEAVADWVSDAVPIIEEISPSFFEVTTAMAFSYFKAQQVDVAVIEVGMGGRLDSTNLIRNVLVSVVTNISMDHMQFLGDTLGKIAGEKAGIAKPGVPLVVGEWLAETRPVFESVAFEVGAPLSFAQEHYSLSRLEHGIHGQAFSVLKEGRMLWDYLFCDLPGIYQGKNIATVMQVVAELGKVGWPLEDLHVVAGICKAAKNSGLRGRMSVLGEKPLVLADIGHNEAGIQEVLQHIRQLQYDRLHVVWGMVADKDIRKVLTLLPKDAHYYYVKPDLPRGLELDQLVPVAREMGLMGDPWPSVREGYAAALRQAGQEDLIFVGGSTFVVAEVI